MDENHLYELNLKEDNYWWHVNKRQLALKYLGGICLSKGLILEVGCGTGLLSALLAKAGANMVAADRLGNATRSVKARGITNSLTFDAGQHWPFRNSTFQIVIMLDVLEHIEDDAACLREARRVLRPGGTAVLSVPAHPFLFSSWDKVVGHHRRYSKSRFRRAFTNAGFQTMVFSYHNALSFVPALFLRGKDRLFRRHRKHAKFFAVPEFINTWLKWWGRLECALIPFNIPMGLSLFAVLKTE